MDVYIGTVLLFAGSYVPANWRPCDGALLPISGNEALYSILGTTYGGNGSANFALPDLRKAQPASAGATPVQYIIATQGIYPPRA